MADFGKILVAVDLTENSLPPLRQALELEGEDADLTILHVVPEDGEEARSFKSFFNAEGAGSSVLNNYALPWLEHWLKDVDIRLPDAVQLEARLGDPAEELLDEASAGNYELVVVGTHGRKGMRRYWMGSVAETAIRRSPCPVLTVRAKVGSSDLIEE